MPDAKDSTTGSSNAMVNEQPTKALLRIRRMCELAHLTETYQNDSDFRVFITNIEIELTEALEVVA